MPTYEFQCGRCGAVHERVLPMGRVVRRRRCPICHRGMARRIPSAPSLMTDTTLSDRVRRSYAVAGHPVESWGDVKRLERDGTCVLPSGRDLDLTERRRGASFKENLRVGMQKLDEKITIRGVKCPKRKRKEKVHAGSV